MPLTNSYAALARSSEIPCPYNSRQDLSKRARWAARRMILPRVTKIDSKTPEANIAGSAATGLVRQFMIKHRSGGSDQRCRLVQTLVPLPNRHAIDRDTTANAKVEPAVGEFEAADDHVEIRTSQRS